MSDAIPLTELAERVERLTGPCRETDALIAIALDLRPHRRTVMGRVSRREVLIGAAAIATVANIPNLPALTTPAAAEVLPAWVVGSEGEYNWQHIIARTEREALRLFAEDCGDYDEDCEHPEYQDGCDCCEAIFQNTAERKPMWDGRSKVSPGDWIRSGTGHICSRCSHETSPDEGAHGVGDEAVCEECMELADWDIVDPEWAANLRANAKVSPHGR